MLFIDRDEVSRWATEPKASRSESLHPWTKHLDLSGLTWSACNDIEVTKMLEHDTITEDRDRNRQSLGLSTTHNRQVTNRSWSKRGKPCREAKRGAGRDGECDLHGRPAPAIRFATRTSPNWPFDIAICMRPRSSLPSSLQTAPHGTHNTWNSQRKCALWMRNVYKVGQIEWIHELLQLTWRLCQCPGRTGSALCTGQSGCHSLRWYWLWRERLKHQTESIAQVAPSLLRFQYEIISSISLAKPVYLLLHLEFQYQLLWALELLQENDIESLSWVPLWGLTSLLLKLPIV